MEAMSYGNCCLVSDIPECVEVVEDKGVTFHKGDVKDLEKKMQMLCDSPQMVEKYRKDASDFTRQKYSWDCMAERTKALYCRTRK